MRPRNDFERELQGYIDSGKVTPPTAAQMEFAIARMDTDKRYKMWYFNTKQTINGMELTKCYKVHRYGKGNRMTFFCLVIIQAQRDKQYGWAARSTGIGYIDNFSLNGELSIKNEHEWYWNIIANEDLTDDMTADPYAVIHYGNHNAYIFHDSRMETLQKSHDAHDYELFCEVFRYNNPISDHIWKAYKIAKRHGYSFQGEMWRWINYINLLRMNKRDWHNPTIICPDNLVEAHNKMIDLNDKRLAAIKEERYERQRREHEQWMMERDKEMKQQEEEARKNYAKEHKKWLGIVIVGDNIVIKPLQSVDEFKAEGEAMHHCVYSCGYYKKKDTLILSAKDNAGKRLATIEYDTKNGVIVQCRAACNQQPKRYDEICALVMDGIKGKKVRCAA